MAGGDFGPEAHALGTMTARMHLALDRAFDRHPEPVAEWVDAAEATIAGSDPALLDTPGMADLTKALRASDVRLPVIRTHGDFHLGRTSRTDQGWVVSDCLPGGVLPGEAGPIPPVPPGRRGRPVVVVAPGQPWRPRSNATRRAGWTWLHSGRPGRRATAGRCSTAT